MTRQFNELRLRQYEFPGMPTRHFERRASDQFARWGFALIYRTLDGDIDIGLANRLIVHPRKQLLIDFQETRDWNPRIQVNQIN